MQALNSSCMTLVWVHEMHGRMHPSCKVLQLVWAHPLLIIGVRSSGSYSWQFALKSSVAT